MKVLIANVTPSVLSFDKPSTSSHGGVLAIDINVSSKESKSPLKSSRCDLSTDVGSLAWASP